MRLESNLAVNLHRLPAARPPAEDVRRASIPGAELRAWAAPQPAVVPPARTEATQDSVVRTSAVAPVSPTRVPPDARVLALLAQDVYQDKAAPPAGWRVAGSGDLDRLGIDRSVLENPQSGFRARVYVEGQGSATRYVVTFRGSQTRGDWIANGEQAVGISTDHYRRALLIGERLSRAQGVDVTITGHSLGGGLASACALASGREATTFNAAGLSDATIRAATDIRTAAGISVAPHVSAYYVRGEILSALQDGGDRVAGALLGAWIGGIGGAVAGARLVDAPEAYGQRIALDAHRPEGKHWWNDNPIARHGMDWVLASL